MKAPNPYCLKSGLWLLLALMLQSCYSTRIVSTHGNPMPAQNIEGDDWYRDKEYGEYTAVVKTSILTDGIAIRVPREHCGSGEVFSVEYKDTFGGNLLYFFSFGTKRKVNIKYVCMQPDLD